jgi:hypothetical protein
MGSASRQGRRPDYLHQSAAQAPRRSDHARVYAHWLPDSGPEQHEAARLDALSETFAKQLQLAEQPKPPNDDGGRFSWKFVVSLTFASWNRLDAWLWQVERLRFVA